MLLHQLNPQCPCFKAATTCPLLTQPLFGLCQIITDTVTADTSAYSSLPYYPALRLCMHAVYAIQITDCCLDLLFSHSAPPSIPTKTSSSPLTIGYSNLTWYTCLHFE